MAIIQKITFEWQTSTHYIISDYTKKRVDSSNYAKNFIHYVF